LCCFSWCFNVNIYCLKYWELRLVNWVKSLQPHFPRSSQSWPCWETFWYNLTSIVTSDGIFTYVHKHFPRFSNCMFLLKKLPPEKKMTASCHPALFESEKSCRWMWKGKENRESGKPGFVLEQKSSNWKISGNGCEHMWKSHRKWRYLSNCIKMFLSTATIGRNEESEVAVIWPNWPILTPNILDSKC
jgi:hypothetical protein